MFHQQPVSRRQLERERLDYKQTEGEILVQQTPARASGQVSPSASSTSYVTCTPDISYSIQTLDSSSATLAKIIDIQRTAKRRNDTNTSSLLVDEPSSLSNEQQQSRSAAASRNSNPVPSTSNNQPTTGAVGAVGADRDNRWTSAVPSSNSGTKVVSQKQQSGETLSSFESDYDLLVYLGETETEDIVDTERSLDYQDQTWRQSICGGASLAPTIDESLSELIGIGSNSNNNHNSYQDFDLLNTPTISPFKAHSPSPRSASTSFQHNRQLLLNNSNNDQISPKQQQHSINNYNSKRLQANSGKSAVRNKEVESDECDHEVSLVFNKQQPKASTSSFNDPSWKSQQQAKRSEEVSSSQAGREHHNQNQNQQKLVGNIGNKIVSLFNRKQAPRGGNNNNNNSGDSLRQLPVAAAAAGHELKRFRNNEFAGLNPETESRAPFVLDSDLNRVKSRSLGAKEEQPNYLTNRSDVNNNSSNKSRGFFVNNDEEKTSKNFNDNNNRYLEDKYRDSELNRIKSAASLLGDKRVPSIVGTNMIGRRQANSENSEMSANDAAELDRLLAEMNQSLDLNSLARYDPIRGFSSSNVATSAGFGQQFRRQQQQQRQQPAVVGTSQTLSKFHHQATSSPKQSAKRQQQQQQGEKYAQLHQQVFLHNNSQQSNKNVAKTTNLSPLSDENNRLKQQTLPNEWKNSKLNSFKEVSPNSNTQASCESILDEYDGASRMLEQMISDQLDNNKQALHGRSSAFKIVKNQQPALQQQQHKTDSNGRLVDSPVNRKNDNQAVRTGSSKQSSSPSAHSATSRRESKSSVIYKEEPQQSPRETATVAATTSASASDQEPTTNCGGLQEQSRKVSTCSSSMTNTDATSVVLAVETGELPANKRDLFENRSVWRHRRSTRSIGHVATPPSGEENSSLVSKPSKKALITTQLSLDQPTNIESKTTSGISCKQRALTSQSLGSTPAAIELAPVANNLTDKLEKSTNIERNDTKTIKTASSEAPTPPEVDYGDSDDGAEVIRVEAVEIPVSSSSDEEENKAGSKGESQMDRMKRRTLTGYRSMRNKFSDFMSNNNEKPNQQQQQQQRSHANKKDKQRVMASNSTSMPPPPKPPKRSSSIGSRSSRDKPTQQQHQLQNEPKEMVDESTDLNIVMNDPAQSERLSRSKRRGQTLSPMQTGAVSQAQPSFGQQIRERLSRSKSRLSKFLRPAAKRAQSTPNTKQDFEIEQNEVDDNDLFQPSDIARNCDISKTPQRGEDSFNESLDRHLAASLAPPIDNKETKRSESESSSLSGLDFSNSRSRSRSKKRKPTLNSNKKNPSSDNKEQQQQQQGRSKSLLSIKRLSSFRNKDNNLNNGEINQQGQVEDLDSIKVSTTNKLGKVKSGKKKRRNKKRGEKNNKSSDEQSSKSSPVNQARVSITNDYFGQIAPAQADSHDEALKDETSSSSSSSSSSNDLKKLPVVESNLTPPAGDNKQQRDISSSSSAVVSPDEQSATSNMVSDEATKKSELPSESNPKRPNRSQSMKCIGRTINGYEQESPSKVNNDEKDNINSKLSSHKGGASKENNSKTSSFSNLNRRLPSSLNTFRPISACAKLDDKLQQNDCNLSSSLTISQQQMPAATSDTNEQSMEHQNSARFEVVTPIGPSNSPFSGYVLDSAKPPQLTNQQYEYKVDKSSHSGPNRGAVSPIRAKSAAVLDDIRNKCSEFFTSPQAKRRAKQQQLADSKALSPEPNLKPVRPPRNNKSNKLSDENQRRRSKSVHAKIAIERSNIHSPSSSSDGDDGDDGLKKRTIIIAHPASPSSSTLDDDGILSPRATPVSPSKHQSSSNKLSMFAQNIRQTFQGSGSKRGNRGSEIKPIARISSHNAHSNTIEPTTTTTTHVEWKPVIAARSDNSKQRSPGNVLNKQLISQLGQTSKVLQPDDDPNLTQTIPIQRQASQQSHSLDTDSTWESSGDERRKRNTSIVDESSADSRQSKRRQQKERALIERDNGNNLLEAAGKLPRSDVSSVESKQQQQQQQVKVAEAANKANEIQKAARSACESNNSLSLVEPLNSASQTNRDGKSEHSDKAPAGFSKLERQQPRISIDDNNNNNKREGNIQDKREKSTISVASEWKQQNNNEQSQQPHQPAVDSKSALSNTTSKHLNIANIIDEHQQKLVCEENREKVLKNRRPIEVDFQQQKQNLKPQVSHSEQNICKTQFKFNANLPSPSQVINSKFASEALDVEKTTEVEFENSSSEPQTEISNIEKKSSNYLDRDKVESSKKGDANLAVLSKNASTKHQQEEVCKEDEDMATISALFRPIRRSERTLDEVDTNILKVMSHSKPSTKAEERKEEEELNKEETQSSTNENDTTSQNRLSIYENVDSNEQSTSELLHAQSKPAKSQPESKTQPKTQTRLEELINDESASKRERKSVPLQVPPLVSEKPAHLVFNQKKIQEVSILASSSKAANEYPSDSSPPDSPSNWSVDDENIQQILPLEHSKSENQFIKEKLEKLIKADEENESAGQAPSPQPERKLVRMTSIIQDPNDELMIGALSSKQGDNTTTTATAAAAMTSREPYQESKQVVKNSPVKLLQRRDSSFSFTGAADDNSDDTDSSFAAAAESRKRLLSKFEQTMLSKQDNGEQIKNKTTTTNRPKFPAFTEGRLAERAGPSGSLVKRMAKNFDQTIQEQAAGPAAVSTRRPPTGIKPVVSKTFAPIRVIPGDENETRVVDNQANDEQKSESVWYDANSIVNLNEVDVDEAELAEFLREFDNDVIDKNKDAPNDEQLMKKALITSGGDKTNKQSLMVTEVSLASETGSVSTGADPFVTVADSTIEDDARGQAIDDLEQQASADDDNTLNDEEQLGSEAEDAELTSNSGENSTDDKVSNKDENDNSEQFGSLATSSPRSLSVMDPALEEGESCDDNRQLKQQQQQGKDKSDNNAADNATITQLATTQLINISSKNASVDDESSRECDKNNVDNSDELDEIERRRKVLSNTKTATSTTNGSCTDEQTESLAASKVSSTITTSSTTPTTTTPTTTPPVALIDNKFKTSLNNIIAQQQQKQQHQKQLKQNRKSNQQIQDRPLDNMTTDVQHQQQQQQQTKDKPSKSGKSSCCLSKNKELKGLSKYYFALLRHSGRHSKGSSKQSNKQRQQQQVPPSSKEKQTEKLAPTDDYLHSSSESESSESESEDDSDEISSTQFSGDDNDDESETSQLDNKKLVRAAKKCSRLYDELERILANRATSALIRKEVASDMEKTKSEHNQSTNEETNNNDDNKATTTTATAAATNTNEQLEDDDELGDYYEETLSTMTERDDQTSLSSSSVSSDSIPEIKQRQNLQKLYHVVNEIYSSEAKFVDTLKLLNEDFRHFVLSPSIATSSSNNTNTTTTTLLSTTATTTTSSSKLPIQVLPPECISSILKHLPPLQALSENLLGELKLARDQWPRTQKIAHVLVKIGPFLKHYSTYIREFESIQQQFSDNMKKYPQFGDKVKEFESSERCQRLTIQHHLLKPIQRIPQYRLLLQQYLHHLKPDDIDYEDTVNALEVVSRVAEHANQAMSEGANFAKLLALQAKIVGKQRDIVQPGRLFVKEGELLKVCRKQIQPRWFILLNDALLYLTQIQSSDILYLNNELPLDDCSVSTPIEDGLTNDLTSEQIDTEFTVSTKTRAFALIAKSRQERDDWVNVFKKTIDDHIARRLSFSYRQQLVANQGDTTDGITQQQQTSEQNNNNIMSATATTTTTNNRHSNRDSNLLLGQKAPLWTPDSRVTMCQLCTSSFSALFRRHHCRACGRVVCSACSSNKAPLIYLKCRTARVCDQCFEVLKANIHLYYLPSSQTSQIIGQSDTTSNPLIKEEELRRLDEHFHTLLKSQFVRHSGLGKLNKLARKHMLLHKMQPLF